VKLEILQNFEIAGKKNVGTDPRVRNPPEITPPARAGLAFSPFTKIKTKDDLSSGRFNILSAKQSVRAHEDVQFFTDLPHQAFLNRFPRFALPSWEFPIPAKAVFQIPLGNQEFPLPVDDRTPDFKNFQGIL